MDNTLKLLNVQVALAIVIGFFGIVNTLLISVIASHARDRPAPRRGDDDRPGGADDTGRGGVSWRSSGRCSGIGLGLAGAKWPLALHVEQVSGYGCPCTSRGPRSRSRSSPPLLIGIVASVLPSRRAARLDVLECDSRTNSGNGDPAGHHNRAVRGSAS
jgi:hypothetical protein